ncbi:MAG TPA: response regulator [Gemmatimonadales bacterium]|nr:response regulator [Gemmatimonadales bacterium]
MPCGPTLLLLDADARDGYAGWRPAPDDDPGGATAPHLGRVLVVDDEEIVRSYVARLLQESGYGVAVAPDGARAWRLIETDSDGFDLIITDVRMPHMDGWQLGRRLAERRAPIPVLYISGFDIEPPASVAATFLRKPFDPEELLRRVTRLLRPD